MHTSIEDQVTEQRGAISSSTVELEKNPSVVTVNSRFGKIEVNLDNKISFNHGILGIPSAISFCLTELPDISNDQFKLLQCLEDEKLSFIVVPAEYDNQLIKEDDLKEACRVLEIEPKNLLLLFIVTVHEKNKERRVSVNAKAPVLVDASNKTATQYVLQGGNYEIQHMIS